MTDAVVLLSGGKDSAIALWWAVAKYDAVTAISVTYPERPKAELLAARRLTECCGVNRVEPNIDFIATVRGTGAEGGPFVTANAYVPMRNLLFFVIAGYFAERLSAERIVAGQLQSDGLAYSDATRAFFSQLERVFDESLRKSFATFNRHIAIDLPLVNLADADAMRLGARLGVPFELTWSCLEDGMAQCGDCVSCRDRRRLLG